MSISKNYHIEKRKKETRVTLTRGEWADILLWLGPQDGNDELYEKLNKRVKIFGYTNGKKDPEKNYD
jgi:hypothetical protein